MSVTATRPLPSVIRLLRERWLELAWVAFTLGNVAVLLFVGSWEIIPFFAIWIGLGIVYFIRGWTLRHTLPVVAGVGALTGAALGWVATQGPARHEELAEAPLMAAMFLVMALNVLQRQKALNETRVAAQREHEFIRDASHALRTPLAIALGHAELLSAAEATTLPRASDRQPGADIGIVVDELKRLTAIANGILLLESAEAGHLVHRSEVDIDRLVEGAARRWVGARERQWSTTVSAHGTLPGDEEQLALSLDCLIENALHATSDGDRISITARPRGEDVVIAVSDTGKGLAEEDRERVFDRFWRGDTRYRGFGLGLAIVKATVEAHAGSVAVESEPGKGTTFSIRIPNLRATPVARRALALQSPRSSLGPKAAA